ncbi:MAG: cupin-like domain-containing protein [Woeseiaceae bacterium]|nr:cupin-like domain-containing protein [Woeseiaceae bacterium]
MLEIDQTVKEVQGVQPDAVPPEILVSTEPLLLKGLVSDWPFVKAGLESATVAAEYLLGFYANATVGAGYVPPENAGRFFYNDDMSGFNFDRDMVKLDQVLADILKYEHADDAPSCYVGSTKIDACLPGFRAQNDVNFGDISPLANFWLGNRTRIAAHWDLPDNLACCAVGRRRFTLFPPEELENLYVGPLHMTPSGREVSLVDFHNPDFDKYPRFGKALKSAQVAELEPGDALFIPSMWWHHVEGLDSLNVLINYWWRQSPSYMSTPVNALNLALLTIRDLPVDQRKVWHSIFQYYVFNADDDTFGHIPEQVRGPLGPIDEQTARQLRADLLNKLNR